MARRDLGIGCNPAAATPDDLSREVYCVLGMPIDAIEMPRILRSIQLAAERERPFVISTPNVNFLVNSQTDSEFREALLLSDLCTADGMPIVWIARLMGLPIKRRTAGSDMFDALKRLHCQRPLKIILFGTTEPVAAAAARKLNSDAVGLNCIGWVCPSFGSVEQLSQEQFIAQVNSSGADFLVVALGAKKGQLWLRRNHDRLRVSIRAHLGATINFQAGVIRRAPNTIRKLGLEWLWRIKEEPHLWSRYLHDGGVLLRLVFIRILPLALNARWLQRQNQPGNHDLFITQSQSEHVVTLHLSGYATIGQVPKAVACFRDALACEKSVVIDFSETRAADARFFGLLLMLRKQLQGRGSVLRFVSVPPRLRRQFRLNGLGYLLEPTSP